MSKKRTLKNLILIGILGLLLLGMLFVGCSTTRTAKPIQYQQRIGNTCSVCGGAPAVYWCSVRRAWFCDRHAGKTYTQGGGYIYRCR